MLLLMLWRQRCFLLCCGGKGASSSSTDKKGWDVLDPNYDTLFYLSNNPPTAVNDTFTTPEDNSLTANVLGNDTDSDGNADSGTPIASPMLTMWPRARSRP